MHTLIHVVLGRGRRQRRVSCSYVSLTRFRVSATGWSAYPNVNLGALLKINEQMCAFVCECMFIYIYDTRARFDALKLCVFVCMKVGVLLCIVLPATAHNGPIYGPNMYTHIDCTNC